MLFVKCHTYTAEILFIGIQNFLVSNSHYKRYKHEESEMEFGKKAIVCKLGDFGKARSMYTHTNALTGENCTTTVRREKLSIHSPRTDN